jgi:tetratricopeptide (TPR) repeat protein
MARTREPVQATKAPSQRIDTQTSEQAIAAINDKRYPEAIELLTELTRRHPTHKRAMVLLRLARARLWVEQREVVRAIEEYEALLEIEPNYSAATCDLALLRCLH